MKAPILPSLLAAAAVAALWSSPSFLSPAAASTPPPTPPPLNPVSASPTPVPAPQGYGFPPAGESPAPNPSGTASPTPPPNARKGIEGVWEVQLQRPNTTEYTHFKIAQDGSTLTGTYLDSKGKKFPIAGSVDGPSFRLIVSLADGTTILMEGRLDGTTDMIGMFTTAKEQLPFTAAYRPKEKWIDNVNASPGGLGQGGGGVGGGGGGGGGYTPPKR